MSILDAIIQGIVQGLTEFLPVSTSGHLAITQHILGTSGDGNLFFNVMLHVGTLVAVIAFYYKLIWSLIKELFSMIKDIFTGKFKWSKMNENRRMIMLIIISLLPLFGFVLLKDFFDGIAQDRAILVITETSGDFLIEIS